MQFLPLVTHNCENLNIPINKTRITVTPKPTKFNTILVITPHSNHTNNQCQTSFISKTQQQRDTGDGSVRKSHQLWRVSKLVFYQLWRNDHVLHYLWSFMVVVVGWGGDGGGGGGSTAQWFRTKLEIQMQWKQPLWVWLPVKTGWRAALVQHLCRVVSVSHLHVHNIH